MNMRKLQLAGGAAEAWVARLMAPDCSAQERVAFEDWLAESPAHIEAYLEVERVRALTAQAASDDLIRAAARVARRTPAVARPGWRTWLPAAAAMLVAAVAALYWGNLPQPVSVQHYATKLGEQRELTLSDGTLLRLDTGSALSTRYDGRQRVVELTRGRAQFVVGEDPRRPFLVKAGATTVRDIGTTFQVSHAGDRVSVGLLEGRVDVSTAVGGVTSLAPGEQVTVVADGRIGEKTPLDVAAAQAWPKGHLIFRQRRLDELLVEMNRYSRQQVHLGDPALGELTVSGVFHAGDQEALIAALERGWPLRAERHGADEVILHARDR